MSDRIGQLILSGVLDVQLGNEFVTGFQAIRLLDELNRPETSGKPSGTAELSETALERGYDLLRLWREQNEEFDLANAVTGRLYRSNTVPLSRSLRRRLVTDEAVLEYMDIDKFRYVESTAVGSAWKFRAAEHDEWWHHWRPLRKGSAADLAKSARSRIWSGDAKLYISPTAEELPSVLATTLPIVVESNATGFKVGKNIYGLSRPDKIVAYFADPEDLIRTAKTLEDALKGTPAQGVPFTADLTGDGLLSWGSDTPADSRERGPLGTSWRAWLSELLGKALFTAAERGYTGEEAVAYAKASVEFAGIDTTSWHPKSHLLQTAI